MYLGFKSNVVEALKAAVKSIEECESIDRDCVHISVTRRSSTAILNGKLTAKPTKCMRLKVDIQYFEKDLS